MANGWMFLNFKDETDDQIEALLKLLERDYPEVICADIGLIYCSSVLLAVPTHRIDNIRRYIQNLFPSCDIAIQCSI